MWHDNEHQFVYVYMYGSVWVSVCCGWPEESSSTSLKKCQRLHIPLSILVERPHKEPCPLKPGGSEKRTKDLVS